MRRLMLPLALACCTTLIAPQSAAFADATLPVAVFPQADSPVRLLGCDAGFADSRYTTNYYFVSGCRMLNNDRRVATVVRIDFIMLDSFESPLGQYWADAEGTYSTNVIIDLHLPGIDGPRPYFSLINAYPNARSVLVAIEKIRFADGTTFTPNYANEVPSFKASHGMAPAVPTPAPSPSSPPSPPPVS